MKLRATYESNEASGHAVDAPPGPRCHSERSAPVFFSLCRASCDKRRRTQSKNLSSLSAVPMRHRRSWAEGPRRSRAVPLARRASAGKISSTVLSSRIARNSLKTKDGCALYPSQIPLPQIANVAREAPPRQPQIASIACDSLVASRFAFFGNPSSLEQRKHGTRL